MLNVVERKNDNQIIYELQIEDKGKIISQRLVKYQIASVEMNNNKYLFIYNPIMKPVEDSFEFLNYFLIDKSENTKYYYMNALKFLYSFESIIGKELAEFLPMDIQLLKDFLLGICRPGENIVFENLTTRASDTVNQFLGVYRQYLEYRGLENKYLSAKRNAKSRYKSGINCEQKLSKKYKTNVKTIIREEVPKYISVEEYRKIIYLVRDKYTIREECIVRLMYETGMRIGEVLGLTNEDIVSLKIDNSYHNCVYIRNRRTDNRYQYAKGLKKPTSIKDYNSKAYNTLGAGYEMVFITDELYDLLGEYIEQAHECARVNYDQRYRKSTIADSVCKNDDNFYIFVNKYGSRLSNVTWNETLREIFKEIGIQVDNVIRQNNLNHRFRHGFAMFQIQKRRIKPLELADLMRHKSVASVKKYYRPTLSDKIKLKEDFILDLYALVPELKEISYAR